MPLISCPDCETQVSNRAPTCPKCGAPIAGRSEAIAAGTPLVTTQQTSKRLKTHVLVAALCIIVGMVWGIAQANGDEKMDGWPILVFMIGLFWFIVSRVRIWWHHR